MRESSIIPSYNEFRREKAADRVRDLERLARGEVTPEQLQEENSFIPMKLLQNAKFDIVAHIRRTCKQKLQKYNRAVY